VSNLVQANEMLLSAKTIKNPEEREAKLQEALQVFAVLSAFCSFLVKFL
jgi:hypothetical protein